MKQAIIAVTVCCAVFAALSYGQGAKPVQQGRFMLATSADGGTAWRIDTATGAASYCLTAMGQTNPLATSTTGRNASCGPWMQ